MEPDHFSGKLLVLLGNKAHKKEIRAWLKKQIWPAIEQGLKPIEWKIEVVDKDWKILKKEFYDRVEVAFVFYEDFCFSDIDTLPDKMLPFYKKVYQTLKPGGIISVNEGTPRELEDKAEPLIIAVLTKAGFKNVERRRGVRPNSFCSVFSHIISNKYNIYFTGNKPE